MKEFSRFILQSYKTLNGEIGTTLIYLKLTLIHIYQFSNLKSTKNRIYYTQI